MIFLNDDFTGGKTNFLPLNDPQTPEDLLAKAAHTGNMRQLQYILDHHDMNDLLPSCFRKNNVNPITIAAERGDLNFLKAMLQNRAQPTMKELVDWGPQPNSPTGLHRAVSRNHPNVVQYLLSLGADTRKTQPRDNENALHIAVRKDHLQCAEQLCLWDAELYPLNSHYPLIKNANQKDCFELALDHKRDAIYDMLWKFYPRHSKPTTGRFPQQRYAPLSSSSSTTSKSSRLFQPHPASVLYSVTPKKGRALIFNHDVNHEGLVVESGVQYIMRTEIIFQRIHPSKDLFWKQDPNFIRCSTLYTEAEKLEKEGQVELSCSMQLEALTLQANTGYSILTPTEKVQEYLGLNIDVWANVFRFMTMKDVLSLSISKNWETMIRNEDLWRTFVLVKYPETYDLEIRMARREIFVDWYHVAKNKWEIDSGYSAPVVIDIGSKYLKFGYMGEWNVKSINSGVGEVNISHNSLPSRGSEDVLIFDYNGGSMTVCFERITLVYEFVKYCYRKCAKSALSLSRQPLIISEPPEEDLRSKLAMDITIIGVRKVEVVPQAVLTLFSARQSTGIVIHLGSSYRGTSLVVDGVVKKVEGRRNDKEQEFPDPYNYWVRPRELITVNEDAMAKWAAAFIRKCPPELQSQLWKNVIVDGGCAVYEQRGKAFLPLLEAQLREIEPSFVSFLRPEDDNFDPSTYPILGGYIYASLSKERRKQ
eukprot:TRINITY_DN2738_c0_g1_i1.p1 TRINITY_DN2738_c0_g1~~TRINITY_DN2738_c0_g1_i1.p1  ORF type:complete len:704 (-),score=85.29 TRINITY_DN2738_c0_g1_i1:10-2121(-)